MCCCCKRQSQSLDTFNKANKKIEQLMDMRMHLKYQSLMRKALAKNVDVE